MTVKIENPPQGLTLWIIAARPHTLTIAASPVIAAVALAFYDIGAINWVVFAATLLCAVAIQAGTNLYNDAADGLNGQDTPERLGPARLTGLGWATADQVKMVAFGSFALAGILGAYLVGVGGWPIAAIGIVSILLGVAYSAGPKPISHTPLGEVFVIAFFGIIATSGTYFLQTGTVTFSSVLIGFCLGLIAAGVLMVNNTRDHLEDIKAGRRTLAILIGQKASVLVYAGLIVAPFALQLFNEMKTGGSGNWLPLLPFPYAVFLAWQFAKIKQGAQLNAVLAQTGKLQFAFALLYALGLIALKTGHAG